MRKRSGKWEWIGLIFTLVIGNLLHFVYDWSGGSRLAAAFSAANESVWEHMKLLAVPFVLFSLAEWLILRRDYSNVLSSQAVGLLAGLLTIPVLFYTYKGIYGQNVVWADIAIFQIAVLLAFFVSHRLLKSGLLNSGIWQLLGLLVLLGTVALFWFFTYRPPALPLFTDPETGRTGPSSP